MFDCVTCGACCANPDENRAEGFVYYLPVSPRDALLRDEKLVRRLVVLDPDGAPHLRLSPDGRCLALRGRIGQRARCEVYPVRPSACRKLEAGSERCRIARRERGIDPR